MLDSEMISIHAGAVTITKALLKLELHYCLSCILEAVVISAGRADAAAKMILQVWQTLLHPSEHSLS